MLLEYGVESYRAGRVRLNRVPLVVRFGARAEVVENTKKFSVSPFTVPFSCRIPAVYRPVYRRYTVTFTTSHQEGRRGSCGAGGRGILRRGVISPFWRRILGVDVGVGWGRRALACEPGRCGIT